MKKILPYILILIVMIGFIIPVHFSLAFSCDTAHTPTCTAPSVLTSDHCSCTYVLLAPLPNPEGGVVKPDFDPTQNNNLSVYLNLMIKLFIGICAVLAVIMIVMGGIEYMTSELPGMKSEGKERIRNAILGLILALGAWTLLDTINPNLLNTNIVPLVKTVVCTPPAVLKNGKCVNP